MVENGVHEVLHRLLALLQLLLLLLSLVGLHKTNYIRESLLTIVDLVDYATPNHNRHQNSGQCSTTPTKIWPIIGWNQLQSGNRVKKSGRDHDR